MNILVYVPNLVVGTNRKSVRKRNVSSYSRRDGLIYTLYKQIRIITSIRIMVREVGPNLI
jgi:hypothetical protein